MLKPEDSAPKQKGERSFGGLISVTFANRSKMVEIVYNERVARGPEEEKAYLANVEAKFQMQDSSEDLFRQLAIENGAYRTCKKYLFFDLEGNLRFEYGGVAEE